MTSTIRHIPADSAEYAKDYTNGWRASQRAAYWDGEGLSALERADLRNVSHAWYDGYEDETAGRDKWTKRDERLAGDHEPETKPFTVGDHRAALGPILANRYIPAGLSDDTVIPDGVDVNDLANEPVVKYESIVFLQGDDANEPLDALYSCESDDSIVYHGPTAESVDAAFAYLRQWDYGEPTEESDEPSSGSCDDVWEQDGYRLSAHLGLGYVGLERVITLPVESYRCPCCGDDVMDTRPVCGDCREAGCEESVDACGEVGYWECDRTDTDDVA